MARDAPPNHLAPTLALFIPLAFLIGLRLLTSDDLEGVTFDPEPRITSRLSARCGTSSGRMWCFYNPGDTE